MAETALTRVEPTSDGALAVDLGDSAKRYAKHSMALATTRAYATKWATWVAHCKAMGIATMPADPRTVANWLAGLADAGPTSGRRARSKPQGQARSTLSVAVFAIKAAHAAAGLDFDTRHPALRLTLRGISRVNAEEPSRAHPLRASLILDVIDGLDLADPIACRDAALLALGYIFGRRRSELVGLDLDRLGSGDGVLRRDAHAIEVVLVRHKGLNGGTKQPKAFLVPRQNNEVAVACIER